MTAKAIEKQPMTADERAQAIRESRDGFKKIRGRVHTIKADGAKLAQQDPPQQESDLQT